MGILGGLAVASQSFHQAGVTVGHFGQGDFLTLAGGLAIAALGVFAKDHNNGN